MCFGVAAGGPEVIYGEQIAPRHKMRAWLFLNRSPSRRWWYGHSYCDTCVVRQHWHNVMRRLWDRDTYHVSRYTGYDTRYASLYLGRDTIRVSPAKVSRCIVTTLVTRPNPPCVVPLSPQSGVFSFPIIRRKQQLSNMNILPWLPEESAI